ncbi:MAG: hypothetical protein CVU74_01100 [Deltaproteobacteria bacterium HGW-Deltaproteobacteria-9]|jgi:hypothetical protein|nr:MAG: hypothetical protein CVU74_01100 [Deltaproteobacteria bacterium HGW-Deltaproteobacteria-9]
MFAEIEDGIIARLNAKLSGVTKVSVDKAHSNLNLNLPIINVIAGGGTFVSVTMSQYKCKTQVFVILTFQNLKSEADRRKGVYPILLAILLFLAGNKFGLKIEALVPKRLDNITEEAEAKAGKIVFQIEFETGFVITPTSDEELVDLLTIGLNYYLQDPADDNIADASDVVTLDQT